MELPNPLNDPAVAARFWKVVKPSDDGQHLLWTGATRNGYGCFHLNGRSEYVHRIAWGPTTSKVLHSCDFKTCVKRSHLHPGSQQQNVMDAVIRGRLRPPVLRGTQIWNARHSFTTIRLVRRLRREGVTCREIAIRFRVSLATAKAWSTGRRRARA